MFFFALFSFFCVISFFCQDLIFADSQMRHTANAALNSLAHGKVSVHAVRVPSAGDNLCRVSFSANGKLCCVLRHRLTTNTVYVVWLFAACVLPWAADGKVFAVCPWSFAVCLRHSANNLSPVADPNGGLPGLSLP
jgi:hypothetical protein